MKTFITVLISILVFSMGSVVLKSIKEKEFERGKIAGEKAGAEQTIQRFVDRKLLLVPPAVDNSTFIDCTFVKVPQRDDVLVVGNNAKVTNCLFYLGGAPYNAITVPEDVWNTYFGYNTIIGY